MIYKILLKIVKIFQLLPPLSRLTAPISRLEQSMASSPEDRNYIDLRRSIYHRNRNILLAIRHTTTSIIQLYPLKSCIETALGLIADGVLVASLIGVCFY